MTTIRTALAFLLTAFASVTFAQDSSVSAAQAAAEAWLQIQDSSDYSESWERASSALRSGVTVRDWQVALAKYRSPLGAVKSRHLKSAQLTSTLPNAPRGEYVVMQYETQFEDGASVVETITPQRESDGSWKVSGYFIK